MKLSRRLVTFVVICFLLGWQPTSPAMAEENPPHFESNVTTKIKPWTNLNFYNDPMNFKFAIVSDRNGGMRPGIFPDAIKKLNLIMPEFVLSVGDFIHGNSADRAELEKEWAEVDAELKPLKVPFFFVPGNHDINNDVMREVWKQRSGVASYSFVYKNVLFLALDSTGEKGDVIPEYQIDAAQKALEKYPNARWTFVFLHHPLWLYDTPNGFPKIEKLLEGRKHTVIAGHFHRYLHEWRNNANYYVLASTGGGSKLRGPRYGEFDHVTLVTITDDGPVMANLRLDGILPHDVTTRADYDLTEALANCSDLPCQVLTDDEKSVRAATIYLTLHNSAKQAMHVRAKFEHAHQVHIEPANIDTIIAASSDKVLKFTVHSPDAIPVADPALLQLHWILSFDSPEKDPLQLSGTRDIALRPSHARLIQTVAPEFVGKLDVVAVKPEAGFTVRYTTDGSQPSKTSPVYDQPIRIGEKITVAARMFDADGHGSATARRTYLPIPPGKGLRYRLYEGKWTRLPDFTKLKPVYEGAATDLNVESRQLHDDNWGMVLDGNFDVAKAGKHTFYLKSDDGAKLYIDDKLVLNNDGDHSLLELNGDAELTTGKHKLHIEFFEAGGEAVLQLGMAAPGQERKPFPVEKATYSP